MNSQKKVIVIGSIGVGVVANEIYAFSTIKMYRYFSFVSSTVPKKVELLKISKVV